MIAYLRGVEDRRRRALWAAEKASRVAVGTTGDTAAVWSHAAAIRRRVADRHYGALMRGIKEAWR